MNQTIKSMLPTITQFFAILGVLSAMGWTIARPLAEDFVQKSVQEEIGELKTAIDQLKASDQATSSQLAVQGEQLRIINDNQKESRTDIKAILRELRN